MTSQPGLDFAQYPSWEGAACEGLPHDLFFKPDRRLKDPFAEGRRVCSGCAIREKCLDWALDNHEQHGIWGGLNLIERRAERRRRLFVLNGKATVALCPSGTSTSPSPSLATASLDWSLATASPTSPGCGSRNVFTLVGTWTSSFTVPGVLASGSRWLPSFSLATGP